MNEAVLTICWFLATAFLCGLWVGWFAGRRYEKSVQALKRARPRRPFTISIDYDFAAAAFRRSGYEIVARQERRVY